ncbi:MAG: diguanylate cyclase [Thermocrinis sp.]|jgi:diguanylate cyclase|nr:diguanylate cyclase [Thermocrinis sp.]
MFEIKTCPLYEKLSRGEPLSQSEKKLLADIVREEIKFLLRNQILPTPKDYERWFYIFCNLVANGQKLEDSALIELYNSIYKEENDLVNIEIDLKHTAQILSDIITELQKSLEESYEQASIKEQRITELQKKEKAKEDFIASLLLELLTLVRDLKRENESFLKKVEAQQKVINELKSKLEKVEVEANLDPLTDLFNRRSLERALEEFFNLCKQSKMSFSLVLIDLDDFKYVNDNYGHHVGDLVLAKVAKVLRTNMRAKDIVGRWGGDEFVVIMPNTDLENAKKVLERIKSQLGKMEILAEGKRFKVSISAGVVQCGENFQSWLDMIKEADRLMYEEKKKKAL